MKLLPLYKLIAGSQADFINQFKNSEPLFKQAKSFWDKMESNAIFIVAIFIFLGLALTFYYYHTDNNKPGRHYTPQRWLMFLVVTFLLSFLVTWGFEYVAVRPMLSGSSTLQFKIAIGNSIYASFLYLFFSWIWCQFNLPTNAYRFFKV